MYFCITCGGTGGHMFPGLAVAGALRERGHDVSVVLSGRAVEAEGASKSLPAGATPIVIPMRPLTKNPATLATLAKAVALARREFKARRPDALLAMGSYTSIAPVLAARILGIPVVLHEANAYPGSAVKWLSRFAATVCTAFDEVREHLPSSVPCVRTGLPLRAEIAPGSGSSHTARDAFSLLVMGGSQGALVVNFAVAGALARLQESRPDLARRLRVVHLAGRGKDDAVRAAYAKRGVAVPVEVLGFSNEMGRLYCEADFCISRAGASSCFELATVGLPSLFIPLPGLANDHQTYNARAMAADGAAEWVAQPRVSVASVAAAGTPVFGAEDARRMESLEAALCERLERAMSSDLAPMRARMLAKACPDAAARVADVLVGICGDKATP